MLWHLKAQLYTLYSIELCSAMSQIGSLVVWKVLASQGNGLGFISTKQVSLVVLNTCGVDKMSQAAYSPFSGRWG